nr:MAG TPA: hypothetical protein [Caudoviricetes sp.]
MLDSVSLRATWRNLETVEIKPTQTAPEAFRGFSLCWWCSCIGGGVLPSVRLSVALLVWCLLLLSCCRWGVVY